MGYSSFRLICAVRIILLAATIALLIYLIDQTSLFATDLIVGAAIIAQIVSLIHYVERTNRDLTRFLTSIRYSDFSQTFSYTKDVEQNLASHRQGSALRYRIKRQTTTVIPNRPFLPPGSGQLSPRRKR